MNRQDIRAMTQGAYDLQKLRIMSGLRLVANFKSKLGIPPGKKEDVLDAEGKKILDRLRREHKLISDAMKHKQPEPFKGMELINTHVEFDLLSTYKDLRTVEARAFRRIAPHMETIDIWKRYLKIIRGIGPAMGGVLIGWLNPHTADYPSSFWQYAGLDVAPDGAGRSRRQEHLIEVEFTNKHGKKDTRMSLTYCPFLKTKLRVLGELFIKMRSEPWCGIYYQYKNRMENHAWWGAHNDEAHKKDEDIPRHRKASKLHRHNMAMRYMLKQFLIDLHRAWRVIEGLPASEPYHVAKLGMRRHREAG